MRLFAALALSAFAAVAQSDVVEMLPN